MLSRPVPSLTYVTYMLSWGLWAQVPDTFLLFSVDLLWSSGLHGVQDQHRTILSLCNSGMVGIFLATLF